MSDWEKYKHCNCSDWAPNLAKINAPFSLLAARNPDTYHGYNGKSLQFCPWCGSKLIVLEIVDDSSKGKEVKS